MVIIEFGMAETQSLDSNSLFLRFSGGDFKQNVDRIKNYWNRKYLPENKEWEVPFSCWEEIKQLYNDTQICYINNPPKAKVVTSDDILNGMDFNGYNLYDYQLDGVRYGLNHHNFLLLDEQGLGKTLQIITLARYKKLHQGLKHCLIICGVNSLKFNWQREVEKFCKDERAVVLGTRVNSKGKVVSTTVEEMKQQIDNVPEEFFWVMNIERIRLNDEDKKAKDGVVHHFNKLIEAGELGMIVIDEVHKSKSITSSTAKGIMAFDSKASKVAMTGTLLVNNPLDLYCPMSFVGLINYNKWLFDKKFVIKDDWGRPVGYQNMDELHNILYRSSIRRTKDLLDLPEKIIKDEVLEFSTDEWKVMDDLMHGDYGGKYLDKIEPVFDTVAMITRMRQITVSTDLVSSTHFKSTKFDRLNDILEEARINGQKVLVFCPFTQALELGLEYCKEYHPKLIKGGMGARVQEVIDEHENTEGFSCIFAQEATLGAGFTLVNTEIVVFLSPPWNRANYDQCCDRCFARNTIVMTTKGPKYIQDIKINDYVYTPYGNIKRVVDTHQIPVENSRSMVNIELFGLGEEFAIKCTDDHKILTSNGDWVMAKDLKKGDSVWSIPAVDSDFGEDKTIDMLPYIEASYKTRNSQGKVKDTSDTYMYYTEIPVTEELMFLLGFYLGDGFITSDLKRIGFCGNCTTKQTALDRIQSYIHTITNATMNIDVPRDGNLGRQLNVRCEPLARFIEMNFGRIGEEKYIPMWVFNLNSVLMHSFLEGLMRSDGHTQMCDNINQSTHYNYVTTTPAIATGIWYLCYRLGYKASFRTRFLYERGAKREYIIEFTQIGIDNPRKDRDIRVGKIKNIKTYSTKVHNNMILYDISVEDDECYMVGNLPVHNCHRIGQKHTVQVINLYIADTYDEEIRNMLSGKGAMSDIVIDADESSRALDYIERMGIVFHKKDAEGHNSLF